MPPIIKNVGEFPVGGRPPFDSIGARIGGGVGVGAERGVSITIVGEEAVGVGIGIAIGVADEVTVGI